MWLRIGVWIASKMKRFMWSSRHISWLFAVPTTQANTLRGLCSFRDTFELYPQHRPVHLLTAIVWFPQTKQPEIKLPLYISPITESALTKPNFHMTYHPWIILLTIRWSVQWRVQKYCRLMMLRRIYGPRRVRPCHWLHSVISCLRARYLSQ